MGGRLLPRRRSFSLARSLEPISANLFPSSMVTHSRLSICYAAPGHSLLSTSGPTRNILSLAEALSQWADVTVAFRTILDPIKPEKYRVIAIEPHQGTSAGSKDDDATRGLNPFAHLSYLRTLRSFSRRGAAAYDLVLEKGWRLSGALSAAFRHRGVPGVLVENDARRWAEPVRGARTGLKYLLHQSAQLLAGFYSSHIPVVIAETDELKAMLVQQRGISSERIAVVGLGVDHALFHPRDQESARTSLGINPAVTVLLYVGGMDKYHDLGPVIEVLAQIRSPSLELHLVGDGEFRARYEEGARRAQTPVRFHGRVLHSTVPEYIAAADVCIAPYRASAFYGETVTFSTLKIPEYMACGRPVVSVPSGAIRRLVEDQASGFLFPNDVASWVAFLKTLPPRSRLRDMGRAAARAVEPLSWGATAARYLEICQQLTGRTAALKALKTTGDLAIEHRHLP
jgi:glycosyltransferase involved in cell wall biosynthesis